MEAMILRIPLLLFVRTGLLHVITGAPLQMPRMTGPPGAMMDRAQMATSQSLSLRPQSEPPHQGPPGVVIPQKALGEHTASIGRTLANQSQSLVGHKLLTLVLTWALVFGGLVDKENGRQT